MISPFSLNTNLSAEPAANIGVKPAQAYSRPQGSSDDANWWMITLSDLTLLLMGFMAAWYTTEKRTHVIQQPPAVVRSAKKEPLALVTPVDNDDKSEEWKTFQNEMEGFIADAGLAKDVSIESTQTDLLVSLRDTVPFASGKAELRSRALPVLEKVVALV